MLRDRLAALAETCATCLSNWAWRERWSDRAAVRAAANTAPADKQSGWRDTDLEQYSDV